MVVIIREGNHSDNSNIGTVKWGSRTEGISNTKVIFVNWTEVKDE